MTNLKIFIRRAIALMLCFNLFISSLAPTLVYAQDFNPGGGEGGGSGGNQNNQVCTEVYRYNECNWETEEVYEVYQNGCTDEYTRKNYRKVEGQCGYTPANSQTVCTEGEVVNWCADKQCDPNIDNGRLVCFKEIKRADCTTYREIADVTEEKCGAALASIPTDPTPAVTQPAATAQEGGSKCTYNATNNCYNGDLVACEAFRVNDLEYRTCSSLQTTSALIPTPTQSSATSCIYDTANDCYEGDYVSCEAFRVNDPNYRPCNNVQKVDECEGVVADGCESKVCDDNLGVLVCIEKRERPPECKSKGARIFRKPGVATDEKCGTQLPTSIGAGGLDVCKPERLEEHAGTECDPNIGVLVTMERWTTATCGITELRPGVKTKQACALPAPDPSYAYGNKQLAEQRERQTRLAEKKQKESLSSDDEIYKYVMKVRKTYTLPDEWSDQDVVDWMAERVEKAKTMNAQTPSPQPTGADVPSIWPSTEGEIRTELGQALGDTWNGLVNGIGGLLSGALSPGTDNSKNCDYIDLRELTDVSYVVKKKDYCASIGQGENLKKALLNGGSSIIESVLPINVIKSAVASNKEGENILVLQKKSGIEQRVGHSSSLPWDIDDPSSNSDVVGLPSMVRRAQLLYQDLLASPDERILAEAEATGDLEKIKKAQEMIQARKEYAAELQKATMGQVDLNKETFGYIAGEAAPVGEIVGLGSWAVRRAAKAPIGPVVQTAAGALNSAGKGADTVAASIVKVAPEEIAVQAGLAKQKLLIYGEDLKNAEGRAKLLQDIKEGKFKTDSSGAEVKISEEDMNFFREYGLEDGTTLDPAKLKSSLESATEDDLNRRIAAGSLPATPEERMGQNLALANSQLHSAADSLSRGGVGATRTISDVERELNFYTTQIPDPDIAVMRKIKELKEELENLNNSNTTGVAVNTAGSSPQPITGGGGAAVSQATRTSAVIREEIHQAEDALTRGIMDPEAAVAISKQIDALRKELKDRLKAEGEDFVPVRTSDGASPQGATDAAGGATGDDVTDAAIAAKIESDLKAAKEAAAKADAAADEAAQKLKQLQKDINTNQQAVDQAEAEAARKAKEAEALKMRQEAAQRRQEQYQAIRSKVDQGGQRATAALAGSWDNLTAQASAYGSYIARVSGVARVGSGVVGTGKRAGNNIFQAAGDLAQGAGKKIGEWIDSPPAPRNAVPQPQAVVIASQKGPVAAQAQKAAAEPVTKTSASPKITTEDLIKRIDSVKSKVDQGIVDDEVIGVWKGVVRDFEGRWQSYQDNHYFFGPQPQPDFKNATQLSLLKSSLEAEKAFLQGLRDRSFRGNFRAWIQSMHVKQTYKGQGGTFSTDAWSSGGGHTEIVKGEVIDIAQKYGDPYGTVLDEGSSIFPKPPQLPGIKPEGLPMDMWQGEKSNLRHQYPGPKFYDEYFQQMEQALEKFVSISKQGPTEEALQTVALYYQYGANARMFDAVNQSLFANQANAMLKQLGLKPIEQGILDFVSMRLQPENFSKYFIDEIKRANPDLVIGTSFPRVNSSNVNGVLQYLDKVAQPTARSSSQLPIFNLIGIARADEGSNKNSYVYDAEIVEQLVKRQLAAERIKEKGDMDLGYQAKLAATDILIPDVIKVEDGYILTTGKEGMVQWGVDSGSYKVEMDPITDINVTIPSSINIQKDKDVIIGIPLAKGTGKVSTTSSAEGINELLAKVFNSNNKKVADQLDPGNAQVSMVLYYDENGNGRYDENEQILPWAGVSIKLTAAGKTSSILLNPGWNLVALSMIPDQPLTASSLINTVSSQGGEVTTISTMDQGNWKSYVVRSNTNYSSDDFKIEPGKAYFIKATRRSTLTYSGQTHQAPLKLQLSSGWNAVGFPVMSQDYTASKILDTINTSSQARAFIISLFKSGLWDTYMKRNNKGFGNDFGIEDTRGYMLKLNEGGEFTP